MELNGSNKDKFWNEHTLNDFQISTIYKNIHFQNITSVCFLKDKRISSSSRNFIFIYNKRTFQNEITIEEKKEICYMNVNNDGILISCLEGTYLNLYEIKGKNYKNIQTIKPFSFLINIIGKFNDSFSIKKFIEFKNGNIAILAWGYAICFYEKKRNSLKYSYLDKYSENVTDICELGNNIYCISLVYNNIVRILNMNSKEIIETFIPEYDFSFSESKNKILLMNKKDLLLVGKKKFIILDIQKKEKIKEIKLEISDYLCFIYKLTNNIIIAGCGYNYIEQLKYDDTKRELKKISSKGIKNFETLYLKNCTSLSIFNNDLIVFPKSNNSLIIYKLKKNKNKG